MGSVLLLAVSGDPTQNLSIFDPASDSPAVYIRTLSILTLAIAAGIFFIVEGILLYSIFRFRRTPDPAAVEPPQVYGSQPIEIAWTAAPGLVVFVLTLVIARTQWEVEIDPERPPLPPPGMTAEPLRVTVIGRQWWWEYQYESYGDRTLGFITANELHVPAGDKSVVRPVYLKLESADVCHSFWVPRLAGKTDLIPGRTNHLWLQTDKPDLYLGQCAEYCGTQHANMLLRVYVDPPAKFEEWLAAQAKASVEDSSVERGRKVFLEQTCINCHAVRDTPARGTYAPDLTHLASRTTLAAGMIPRTRKNLRDWVADPQKIKPGCLMPAFGLSEGDLDAVVDYLETLK